MDKVWERGAPLPGNDKENGEIVTLGYEEKQKREEEERGEEEKKKEKEK